MTTPKDRSDMSPIEVITSVQRRRRWTPEEKRALLEEAEHPGSSVSAVARKYGVNPNQLFHWRKLMRESALFAVGADDHVVPASEVKVRVYLRNIRESLTGTWDYYAVQIPDNPRLRRFLEALNRSLFISLGVQLMLAAGFLAGFIPGQPQTRLKFRRWAWGGLALILIPVYFGALSGPTFWVGSRIRFPGEFAQIALLLSGAWILASRVFELTRFRRHDLPQ